MPPSINIFLQTYSSINRVIHKCISNPELLQNFRLSSLYTIPSWGRRGIHITSNFTPTFHKSPKHGVGRACQNSAQCSAQLNSMGDATPAAEEPAAGSVKAICSSPTPRSSEYMSSYFGFKTYSKWEEQNRKCNTRNYCFVLFCFV